MNSKHNVNFLPSIFSMKNFEVTSNIFSLFQQLLEPSRLDNPVRNIFAMKKSLIAISNIVLMEG